MPSTPKQAGSSNFTDRRLEFKHYSIWSSGDHLDINGMVIHLLGQKNSKQLASSEHPLYSFLYGIAMKQTFPLILLGSFIVAAGFNTAAAKPILWTFPTVTFDLPFNSPGGGTASGSFTYDASTNRYSAWTFNIGGFADTRMNGVLTPDNSMLTTVISPQQVWFLYPGRVLLDIRFLNPEFTSSVSLTDAGGSVGVIVGAVTEISWYARGTLTASSSVPETSSILLILIGGAAVCSVSIWTQKRRLSGAAKLSSTQR